MNSLSGAVAGAVVVVAVAILAFAQLAQAAVIKGGIVIREYEHINNFIYFTQKSPPRSESTRNWNTSKILRKNSFASVERRAAPRRVQCAILARSRTTGPHDGYDGYAYYTNYMRYGVVLVFYPTHSRYYYTSARGSTGI